MPTCPDFRHEEDLRARGMVRIAGVDEAGRGPLCGPVVAAAVILDAARLPDGVNDSKLLSPARREALYGLLLETAAVGIGMASVEEIDSLNILRASHLAMMRALSRVAPSPEAVLVDGPMLPDGLGLPAHAIVRGDTLSLSIAAASIVAKVTRDRVMVDLAQQFPHYGWERNAGYATAEHRAALKRHGPTPHHRRSFAPVYQML